MTTCMTILYSLWIKTMKNLLRQKPEEIGRGRRTRTLNKGFGDPRVTITPCPFGVKP